jgi:hypothetical protein
MIEGNWIIESLEVNGVESDNIDQIEFEFFDSGEVIRTENANTDKGIWDFSSSNRLRINWDEGKTTTYSVLTLTNSDLKYSYFLDQGIGFPQLELTYSFKKSKSSG